MGICWWPFLLTNVSQTENKKEGIRKEVLVDGASLAPSLFSLFSLQAVAHFSSKQLMMASFLAEIWKEREAVRASAESWLYYWDTANKRWCRPGIPLLAPPLCSPQHGDGLQNRARKKKMFSNSDGRNCKKKKLIIICRCLLKFTSYVLWFYSPWQLFCINQNSHTADCSLPKSVMKLPATLWHRLLLRPHTVLIPKQSISRHPASSCSAKSHIWERQLFEKSIRFSFQPSMWITSEHPPASRPATQTCQICGRFCVLLHFSFWLTI